MMSRFFLLLSFVLLLVGCSANSPASFAPRTRAIVFLGHSNGQGHNVDPNGSNSPPDGSVRSDVLMLRRALVPNETIHDDELVSLRPTTVAAGTYHGAELATGLFLSRETPDHIVFLKLTANGSGVADWADGGAYHDDLVIALSDFGVLARRRFPDAELAWDLVVFLGADEGSSRSPSGALALGMPPIWSGLHDDIDERIGTTTEPRIVLEPSAIRDQPYLPEELSAQREMAQDGVALDPDGAIGRAELQSDGRHWNASGHNALGFEVIGTSLL